MMKAMIFAAGLGTRLRPLTDSRPKALVEVDGKPLLGHLMEKLRSQGFDEVVVNVHHFAALLEDYIRSNDGFGMKVSISDERELLGDTGGGLLHARPLLEGSGQFLVHNVDVLSNLDFSFLTAETQTESATRESETQQKPATPEPALATLVVSDRPTSRYLLFNNELRLVGWENRRTGEIRSPYLKGAAITSSLGIAAPEIKVCPELRNARALAFSGIQTVSDSMFPELEKYASEHGEVFSIIDFYISACADFPIYGLIPEDFKMLDVGKLDALPLAGQFLRGTKFQNYK
ncbi:MAG: NTP transferase domain-containing protein [Bacteroidales bacterium]|nr:NTP transferase domain-containing protein [Bacteroidales bacterium]